MLYSESSVRTGLIVTKLNDARDRTKPGVPFWATVVVVVALLYPISFGPACWLASRTGIGASALPAIYRPVISTMNPGGITGGIKETMPAGSYESSTSHATVPPTQTLRFYPSGIVSRYAPLLAADGWQWRWGQSFYYSIKSDDGSLDDSIGSDDGMDVRGDGKWEWSISGR